MKKHSVLDLAFNNMTEDTSRRVIDMVENDWDLYRACAETCACCAIDGILDKTIKVVKTAVIVGFAPTICRRIF